MIKTKICIQCKRVFNNKRKDGYFLGDIQFSKRKWCSRGCVKSYNFKPNLFVNRKDELDIYLENKKVWTTIESKDYDKVKDFRWYLGSLGYPEANGKSDKNPVIRMHSLIIGKIKGMDVDHVNRNKLDNRDCNLRIVTHSENLLNSKRSKINML